MEENFNNEYENTNSYSDTSYSSSVDPYASTEPEGSKTLSIVSLVLGIVGFLISCCCCIGVPFDIAAIVTGIISKKKNAPGGGMALAGIILGAIALVIYLITVIINLATNSGEAFANSFIEGFNEGLNGGAAYFFI